MSKTQNLLIMSIIAAGMFLVIGTYNLAQAQSMSPSNDTSMAGNMTNGTGMGGNMTNGTWNATDGNMTGIISGSGRH